MKLLPFYIILHTLYQSVYVQCSKMFDDISKLATKEFEFMEQSMNFMHQFPEVFSQEKETPILLEQTLKSFSIPYVDVWACDKYNKDGFALVAQIGTGQSPCVAIISAFNAPNVCEMNDSKICKLNNVSHVSGNDAHTAMMLGAAKILKTYENKLKGTVKFIFQSNSEDVECAQCVLKEGVHKEHPKIDWLFGLQVDPLSNVGEITSKSGEFWASKQTFKITVSGKGGHAAMHHQTIDPLPAVAAIIRNLNDMNVREFYFQPEFMGVANIGNIRTGNHATNVVPGTVTMMGTYRAFNTDMMNKLNKRISEIVAYTSMSYQCVGGFELVGNTVPTLKNDENAFSFFEETLSNEGLSISSYEPQLSSSDFANFFQHIPGVYFMLGAGGPEYNSTYTANFNINHKTLPVGATMLSHICTSALEFLSTDKKTNNTDKFDEL